MASPITITLPDGSQRHYDHEVTPASVAADIGAGLARAAIAAKVNDVLVDLSCPLTESAQLALITHKSPEALGIIRHSTAHLLAHAVKQLFPSAQVTIGPVIEDGFYYDFAFERPFTPDDLEKIEARMHELAAQDIAVKRFTLSRDEAIKHFLAQGEQYKAQIIEAIPTGETLSLYQQADFTDLCRGPHVPHVKHLGAFKLTKLAGAYWRGDSNNEMLQRIYGTAWLSKADLEAYLTRLVEAEKRDHRRIGKELDLFHFQDIAPGMVFWHNDGWRIYQTIEQYIRQKLREYDYQEVRTPQILSRLLWEQTGHWQNYREEMFTTESESHAFAIKPMNCPGHVQIFKHGLKSYRDLPIRMAEFGSCHRNELSGALHGLMRVRAFVQDDAHIFCTENQIQQEVGQLIDFIQSVYHDFGFNQVQFNLSTRPAQRVGSDAVWDKAEAALAEALSSKGIPYALNPGDGAFYGPKIDFRLQDSIGRIWQCGTIQLDFSMPLRLEASYIAEDGSKQVPVMIHRAILGSFERFIGMLIEHHAGKFPTWLAPVQVALLNISEKQTDYTRQLGELLKKNGLKVEIDLRNEKIGFKIREHTLKRVPYLFVIGDREAEQQHVAIRTRAGADLGSMPIAQALELIQTSVREHSLVED